MSQRELFATYMYRAFDGKTGASNIPEFDSMSLLDLAKQRGASSGALDLIRNIFWFGRFSDDASAASGITFFQSHEAFGFPGGADSLPLAFAKRLGARIRYGSEVVSIEQDASKVDITTHAIGRQERITADRVICTIPFSVLRTIDIRPGFSPIKQEIVRNMSYHPATRVFHQVRERFWEKHGLSASAYTDLPVASVMDQPMILTGTEDGRAIIEAHVRGDRAAVLDAMTDEERLEFSLRNLKKVHPDIDQYTEGGRSKSWQNDRWARGAYSYYRPGEMGKWLPEIVRPEGRIHFAGEHTSFNHASLEGALESGVRAAKEMELP